MQNQIKNEQTSFINRQSEGVRRGAGNAGAYRLRRSGGFLPGGKEHCVCDTEIGFLAQAGDFQMVSSIEALAGVMTWHSV